MLFSGLIIVVFLFSICLSHGMRLLHSLIPHFIQPKIHKYKIHKYPKYINTPIAILFLLIKLAAYTKELIGLTLQLAPYVPPHIKRVKIFGSGLILQIHRANKTNGTPYKTP